MNLKEFYSKNKKAIFFVVLVVILLVGVIFLIYDYRNMQKKHEIKAKEKENFIKALPEDLKKNIPNKGDLIYIETFINETKKPQMFPLIKQNYFRKSLYYTINRTKITESIPNLKPTSMLFTKSWFEENKKYFPKLFLPQSLESIQIYQDLDLKNYGFNQEKALSFLKKSWCSLTPEEKNKEYILKLKIDEELAQAINNSDSFSKKIIEQIQSLFQSYSETKNKLNIEIVSNDIFDIRLTILPTIDEFNKEDYYLHLIQSGFLTKDDSNIEINFKLVKQYLENKKAEGKQLETDFFTGKDETEFVKNKSFAPELKQYLIQYKKIDNNGIFKDKLNNFWDMFENNIIKLFPSLQTGAGSQIEESQVIQDLKQKTFEEIFEKILCLLYREMLNIPICVYSEN